MRNRIGAQWRWGGVVSRASSAFWADNWDSMRSCMVCSSAGAPPWRGASAAGRGATTTGATRLAQRPWHRYRLRCSAVGTASPTSQLPQQHHQHHGTHHGRIPTERGVGESGNDVLSRATVAPAHCAWGVEPPPGGWVWRWSRSRSILLMTLTACLPKYRPARVGSGWRAEKPSSATGAASDWTAA